MAVSSTAARRVCDLRETSGRTRQLTMPCPSSIALLRWPYRRRRTRCAGGVPGTSRRTAEAATVVRQLGTARRRTERRVGVHLDSIGTATSVHVHARHRTARGSALALTAPRQMPDLAPFVEHWGYVAIFVVVVLG